MHHTAMADPHVGADGRLGVVLDVDTRPTADAKSRPGLDPVLIAARDRAGLEARGSGDAHLADDHGVGCEAYRVGDHRGLLEVRQNRHAASDTIRALGGGGMDMIGLSPVVKRWKLRGTENPDGLWAEAADQLPWFAPWERVFEWTPPTFRWFVGGRTNLSYNCLDHHVQRGWGGHAALIAENERGERRVLTYAQLLEEVKRTAAAVRGLGVKRGDRIAIYMPTCVEAIVLMLAVTRIG